MKKHHKKFAAFMAVIIIMLSLLPGTALSAAALGSGIPGDVDGDGYLMSADSLMILRTSIGLATLTPEQMKIADADGDGVITSADALSTLRSSTGDSGKLEDPGDNLQATYNKILRLINRERKKAGLSELEYDYDMQPGADIRVMETAIKFDHTRPNGKPWNSVFEEVNFKSLAEAENIVAGTDVISAEAVVKSWMNSEGHRKNILNPEYTHMCAAYLKQDNTDYIHYWVQLFSKKAKNFDNEKAVENQVKDLINQKRSGKGMSSLKMNEALRNIAEVRADELIVSNTTLRPNGTKYTTLLDDYGIDYTMTTQIVCSGQQNANEVVDFLINNSDKPFDPSRHYTDIGVGHAFKDNDTQGHYWVIILLQY